MKQYSFKKYRQLYHWSDPSDIIESQYGLVTIRVWLEKEKERILKDPSRTAYIKTNALDQISLFVDDVSHFAAKNKI